MTAIKRVPLITMTIATLIAVTACGSSTSTPSETTTGDGGAGNDGAAVAASINVACVEQCRNAKCQPCGEVCVWRCVREDYVSALVHCLNDPALVCDAKADDNCGSQAIKAITAHAGESDFTSACLKRRTECKSSFADDNCLQVRVLNDACFAEAKTCLDKPCADVAGCIKALYK